MWRHVSYVEFFHHLVATGSAERVVATAYAQVGAHHWSICLAFGLGKIQSEITHPSICVVSRAADRPPLRSCRLVMCFASHCAFLTPGQLTLGPRRNAQKECTTVFWPEIKSIAN